MLVLFLLLITGVNALAQNQQSSFIARVGTMSSGTLDKDELLKYGKLSLIEEEAAAGYRINSFRLTRVRKSEVPVELNNDTDSIFTPEMIELIKNSISGDKLYFEYIKCKGPDGTVRSLRAVSFVIE